MILGVLSITILLISCSYIINETNANYLLAGYNTMSEKEKENFDLKKYLKFFKSFFLNIALLSLLIYLILILLLDEELAAIAYAISISIPWPYFVYKSNKFIKH
jgi:ascorbate-specific PTS system EIIC-type component UlaA